MTRRYTGVRTAEGKTCAECKRLLSFDNFRQNNAEQDGLTWYCKDCLKTRSRRRYQEKHGAKVQTLVRELKSKYVDAMGGQCIRCGYKEFLASLDFHHTENKENTIANLMGITAQCDLGIKHIAILEQELAKCVLLCSNCHRGIHAGEWSLDEPTYTRRAAFVPEIKPFVDEIDYLPLFESPK
jgi:hypothetical protein